MPAFDKIRRSWLLVPMSKPERIASAHRAGADVVVLDLVEFVAEADKPAAREMVAQSLASVKSGGAEVFVQIEPDLMLADLRAAVWPGLNGIVVSRAESAEQIGEIDAIDRHRSKASAASFPAASKSWLPLKLRPATTPDSKSPPPVPASGA